MEKRTEEFIEECIAYTLGLPLSVMGLAERLAAAEEAQRELVQQGLQLQEKLRLAREEAALSAGAVKKHVVEVEHWRKETARLEEECALYLHDRELFMEVADEAEERANDANQQAIQANNELQQVLIQIDHLKHSTVSKAKMDEELGLLRQRVTELESANRSLQDQLILVKSHRDDAPVNQRIEQLEQENRELRMLLKTANTHRRTSKVRDSSVPNNFVRGLPKVSAKPDSGVVTRKEADVAATKREKSVSLTTSINPRADKRMSTRQVLKDKKQASKEELNSSTVTITSRKEASANGAPPKTASSRTPRRECTRHQDDNLTAPKKKIEKKQPESKKGGDVARSTSAGSHKSPSASRLDNKANRVVFSFKSDERADKRKEFYMELEEKMHAKEAKTNQIQAKTQINCRRKWRLN